MYNDVVTNLPRELKMISPAEEMIWRFDSFVTEESKMNWSDDLFADPVCPAPTSPWNVAGTHRIRTQLPWHDDQTFTRGELIDCHWNDNIMPCIHHEALAHIGIDQTVYDLWQAGYERNRSAIEDWAYNTSEFFKAKLTLDQVELTLADVYSSTTGSIAKYEQDDWGVSAVNSTDNYTEVLEPPLEDEVIFVDVEMEIAEPANETEMVMNNTNATVVPYNTTDEEVAKGAARRLLTLTDDGHEIEHVAGPVMHLERLYNWPSRSGLLVDSALDMSSPEGWRHLLQMRADAEETIHSSDVSQDADPDSDHDVLHEEDQSDDYSAGFPALEAPPFVDANHPTVKRLVHVLHATHEGGATSLSHRLLSHVRSATHRVLALKNPLAYSESFSSSRDSTFSSSHAGVTGGNVKPFEPPRPTHDDHFTDIPKKPPADEPTGLHRVLLAQRSLLARKRSNANADKNKPKKDELSFSPNLMNAAENCEDLYVNSFPFPEFPGAFSIEVLLSATYPAAPFLPMPSKFCWGQISANVQVAVVSISGHISWDFGSRSENDGGDGLFGLEVSGCLSAAVGVSVKGVDFNLIGLEICIYAGLVEDPDYLNEQVAYLGVYAELTIGCDVCGFKGIIKADGRITALPSERATRHYATEVWGKSDAGCRKTYHPAWTFQVTLSGSAELCMFMCATVWEGIFYQSDLLPILYPFCTTSEVKSGACEKHFWHSDMCKWQHNTGCKGGKSGKNNLMSKHVIGKDCASQRKFLGGFRVNDKVCYRNDDATIEYYCSTMQDSGWTSARTKYTNCGYGGAKWELEYFDSRHGHKWVCNLNEGYIVNTRIGLTSGCQNSGKRKLQGGSNFFEDVYRAADSVVQVFVPHDDHVRMKYMCAKPNNWLRGTNGNGWETCKTVYHQIGHYTRGNEWYYLDRADLEWCPDNMPVLKTQRLEPAGRYGHRWVTSCCRYESGSGVMTNYLGSRTDYEDYVLSVRSSFDRAGALGDNSGRFAIVSLEFSGGKGLYNIESFHLARHAADWQQMVCEDVNLKYSNDLYVGEPEDMQKSYSERLNARNKNAMCPPGMFITHLIRDSSNSMGGLRKFRCCGPKGMPPVQMDTFVLDDFADIMWWGLGFAGCSAKKGYALIGLGIAAGLDCPPPRQIGCEDMKVNQVDSYGAKTGYEVTKRVCKDTQETTCNSGKLNKLKRMVCGRIEPWVNAPEAAFFTAVGGGLKRWNLGGGGLEANFVYKIASYSPYANKLDTYATVQGPVKLKFTGTFEIESSSSCRYDWLKINGVKYCSHSSKLPDLNQPISLPSGEHRIEFKTDYSVTKIGFTLEKVLDSCVPCICDSFSYQAKRYYDCDDPPNTGRYAGNTCYSREETGYYRLIYRAHHNTCP